MSDIWAIVLAAGESRRMGSPKMLLPFNGKTIIENVIENIINSKVENIIVVLGSEQEKILRVIEGMPVKHCYNENYKTGMLSSVKCGFNFLPESFSAAIVFPGDQPTLDTGVITLILKSYLVSGKGIIVPVYKGRRGHPLLVDRRYRTEIEKLDPEEGLRSLSGKFPGDVFEVTTGSDSILTDIDSREDYLRIINQTE